MGFVLPYKDFDGDYPPDSFEDKTTKNLSAVERRLNVQTSRVVHGLVDSSGGVVTGVGFTPSQSGTGEYEITFDVGFESEPSLSLTPSGTTAICRGLASATGVLVQTFDAAGSATDSAFYFVAIL